MLFDDHYQMSDDPDGSAYERAREDFSFDFTMIKSCSEVVKRYFQSADCLGVCMRRVFLSAAEQAYCIGDRDL